MSERDDELDGLRIRRVALLRRSTYRARSYAIIAAIACLIGALDAIVMAVRDFESTAPLLWPGGFIVISAVLLYGAGFFVRRALALHRQARESSLPEPVRPPDFTGLGDGSNPADRLNNVR